MRKNLPVTDTEVSINFNHNILSTTGLKGVITYCNPDFEEISGFKLDELIGQAHNIVRHPDMPQAAFADLWLTLESDKSWSGIVKNRCKNGDYYWVDAYATPISDFDGKVTEYQSIRRKAQPDDIKRAKEVYAALNARKSHKALKAPSTSLRSRIFISFGLLFFILAGAASQFAPIEYVGIALTGMLAASWGIATWLTKPLYETLHKVRDNIGNTNYRLAKYIYTGRTDEFGTIMMALKACQSESAAIVGRVEDTSRIIMQTASTLVTNVELSNNAINLLHDQTDKVAVGMNQLAATSEAVASNAQEANDTATETINEATRSRGIVNTAVESINTLASEVDNASSVIQALEEESQSIGSVVSVIRDITDQTNLLALNAAIEAARAGEMGRGFAVVADEVRTLAKRTQDSTEEITTIISSLQSRTSEAVDVMQRGKVTAEKSVKYASEAGDSLVRIGESIQHAADKIEHIAHSAQESLQVANEVTNNVMSINDNAETTLSEARKTEASSIQLAEQSTRLMSIATQFKSKAAAAAAAE